jgi:hypothetical protein
MDAELSPTEIEGLPYENTPNGWFIRYEPVNGWVRYKNNSLGMRDKERTFEKSTGIKRIVCLGDSVMYGGEVSFKEIFSQQLEKKLNSSRSFKAEVLNCAVSSYSLREYPIYLKHKGIKFKPELVIVGLCLNDYKSFRDIEKNNHKFQGPNMLKINDETKVGRYKRQIKRFLLHSYFIEYIQKFFVTLEKKVGDNAIGDAIYNEMLQKDLWFKNRERIKDLKQICEQNNAKLLFVIFPLASQLNSLRYDQRPQVHIKALLDSLNIPYVDIRKDFIRYAEADGILFSPHDSLHFLPPGHNIAAEVVYVKIKELNFFNE